MWTEQVEFLSKVSIRILMCPILFLTLPKVLVQNQLILHSPDFYLCQSSNGEMDDIGTFFEFLLLTKYLNEDFLSSMSIASDFAAFL